MNDMPIDHRSLERPASPAVGRAPRWRRMAGATRVIAWFTVIEALRGRWALAAFAALGLAAGAMAFAAQMAVIDRATVALAIGAPLLRLACVLLVGVFGVTLVVRELSERTVDLTLAAPVSRGAWLAGKWAGVAAVAMATALLAAVALAPLAEPAALAVWTASLALETALVAALAIVVSVSLAQVPIALLALGAFYALARVIGVLLLLQERAPLEVHGAVDRAAGAVLQALAHALPRLDLFTRTEWLLAAGVPPMAELGPVLAQAVLYGALLAVVGAIDFGRRDV